MGCRKVRKNLDGTDAQANLDSVCVLAKGCIGISRADWDTQETSWDFKRNPLI